MDWSMFTPWLKLAGHLVLGAAITAGSAYASNSPVDPHTIVGGALAILAPLYSLSPGAAPKE